MKTGPLAEPIPGQNKWLPKLFYLSGPPIIRRIGFWCNPDFFHSWQGPGTLPNQIVKIVVLENMEILGYMHKLTTRMFLSDDPSKIV